MASFNSVTLVGNLTRDPDVKTLQGGTILAEIGLAVNERVKKGESWVDEPLFVDVTMFGRTAEVAKEYLVKGSPCLVSGRLRLETWEKDGQKRSKIKVVAEKMQLLGSKNDGEGRTDRTAKSTSSRSFKDAAKSEFSSSETDGSDVPF